MLLFYWMGVQNGLSQRKVGPKKNKIWACKMGYAHKLTQRTRQSKWAKTNKSWACKIGLAHIMMKQFMGLAHIMMKKIVINTTTLDSRSDPTWTGLPRFPMTISVWCGSVKKFMTKMVSSLILWHFQYFSYRNQWTIHYRWWSTFHHGSIIDPILWQKKT